MSESPIFVIGNPRSGTTLLRLIIAAHSKISIAPESEFIVRLFPKYGHIKSFQIDDLNRFLQDICGKQPVLNIEEQWQISMKDYLEVLDDHVGESYEEVCASLYKFYSHEKGFDDKEIWGDKNNAYGNYIDVLTLLYPDAKFIHVVRDGRAVLSSYNKLKVDSKQKYAPLLPKQPEVVANRWLDMVGRIDQHLKKHARGRFIEIRYEDVLNSFEETITGLCEFIGVEYEDNMVQFYQNNVKHGLEPTAFSWKENTRKPLDKGKSEEWKASLPEGDIRRFESLAATLLVQHSYDLLYPQSHAGLSENFRSLHFHLIAKLREIARGFRRRFVAIKRLRND